MEQIKNKFVTTTGHIDGAPSESDFEIKTQTISLPLGNSEVEVIVKNLYVSIDPYLLNRMKTGSSGEATHFTAIKPGQVIGAYGVGRVVESRRPDLSKGELVAGFLTWGEYTPVEKGRMVKKLDPMGLPLPYHIGPLGFSGLAAYSGFFEVCKPKKGESIFVSASSGSVGNIVGQFAKLFGCHVVGCAGSQKKVNLLKEKLGFDDAFNYKEETDLKSALKRCFPNGIDMYFDNVGGELLEAVVANMNTSGRVAVCGVISEYTGGGKKPALELVDVVNKKLTIQGFMATDYLKYHADFISTTAEHLRAGKMHALCDVSDGLESVPRAFIGVFRGDNIGKKIVKIADE